MSPKRTKGGESSEEEDETHYVLSENQVGLAIADLLHSDGHQVSLVDESYDSTDIPGFVGDPADLKDLSESGAGAASTVIVATQSDSRTFLIAQLVRARFDVPRVIALVNDPNRVALFSEAGHEPFCVTTAVSEVVVENI